MMMLCSGAAARRAAPTARRLTPRTPLGARPLALWAGAAQRAASRAALRSRSGASSCWRAARRRLSSGGEGEAKGGGLGAWYNAQIEARPVITKSLTSAVICAGGDLLCQLAIEGGQLDLLRTARFGACGLFLVGPIMHNWVRPASPPRPSSSSLPSWPAEPRG